MSSNWFVFVFIILPCVISVAVAVIGGIKLGIDGDDWPVWCCMVASVTISIGFLVSRPYYHYTESVERIDITFVQYEATELEDGKYLILTNTNTCIFGIETINGPRILHEECPKIVYSNREIPLVLYNKSIPVPNGSFSDWLYFEFTNDTAMESQKYDKEIRISRDQITFAGLKDE